MRTWKVIGRDFENKPVAILVKARTIQAAAYRAGRGQVSVPRIDSIALHQTPEEKAVDLFKCVKAFKLLQTFNTP